MEQVDFLTVTGSASNVRAGQTSGTPNACVSAGNVVSIVDSTADIEDAARKIHREQDLRLRHQLLQRQLGRHRGARLRGDGRGAGARGRVLLRRRRARPPAGGYVARRRQEEPEDAVQGPCGDRRGGRPGRARRPGTPPSLWWREKASGTKTPSPARSSRWCSPCTRRPTSTRHWRSRKESWTTWGVGHSCGLHTTNEANAERIGFEMEVCRLLINQVQVVGNGGSFDNGLNFTLSMGGGTWAGNNIGENLSYKHFINITRVSRLIPEVVPTHEELLGEYWREVRKVAPVKLFEYQAKDLFREAGIPVPEGRLVGDAAGLDEAIREVGVPLRHQGPGTPGWAGQSRSHTARFHGSGGKGEGRRDPAADRARRAGREGAGHRERTLPVHNPGAGLGFGARHGQRGGRGGDRGGREREAGADRQGTRRPVGGAASLPGARRHVRARPRRRRDEAGRRRAPGPLRSLPPLRRRVGGDQPARANG